VILVAAADHTAESALTPYTCRQMADSSLFLDLSNVDLNPRTLVKRLRRL